MRETCLWEVTSDKVELAVARIIELSRPVKVILFGSYPRGKTDINSDVDILVVSRDEIDDPRRESVRLRHALRDIAMPMDILVVPHTKWEELKEVPGLVYREAYLNGQVVYES